MSSAASVRKGDYKPTSYRRIFTKNRAMEFFDPDELTKQTEQPPQRWPIVVLKEIIDNSLDACENADILPHIETHWNHTTISEGPPPFAFGEMSVKDNGPGFPLHVLDKITDFSVFVSDKEAYVAPTRGRQGNALKTVLTIPHVLATTHGIGGGMGHVRIESNGLGREVSISLDRIRGEPILDLEEVETDVTDGTKLTVWPLYSPLQADAARADFYHFLQCYALFNPHAEFVASASETPTAHNEVSHPRIADKIKKWQPSDPSSPHWYDAQSLGRLIGYHIGQDDITLREFLGQFDGLKSTLKRAEISGMFPNAKRLSDFETDEGKLDAEGVTKLLGAMQASTKKIKAHQLGVLGKDSLLRFCPEEKRELAIYTKFTNDEIPRVIEISAWAREDSDGLRIYCGLNHSPTYDDPLSSKDMITDHNSEHFQGRGITGLVRDLMGPKADSGTVVVHFIQPEVKFRGKGKTTVA